MLSYFDSIFAQVPFKPYKMEFEKLLEIPVYQILDQIKDSNALFLLGPKTNYSKYTSNWIAFEIGAAAALGTDIWVFEEVNRKVKFPIH